MVPNYTDIELSEEEIKKKIQFTIPSKTNKTFNSLTEDVKKTEKWKNNPCSSIRRITLLKCGNYPK